MEDFNLLREYVEHDSDVAFESILNRHINLVYSTAIRQVRDPALASEVTQTTFIILARKAHSLDESTVLSGWLYRTAQYAAARALRSESRRREREQEAAKMQTEEDSSIWDQLSPILDQAMARLNAADRDILLLRYFENKSSREVGTALGINETAAQKRLVRAVEKLRALCTKRGVAVTGIALTALISANGVQAAPAIAIGATAGAVKGVGISGSTAALVKSTLNFIAWNKFKFACYLTLGSLVIIGASAYTGMPGWMEAHLSGNPLDSYLARLDDGKGARQVVLNWEHWSPIDQRTRAQKQAADAIQAMGTNALPYLLEQLEKPLPPLNLVAGNAPQAETFHRRAALALDVLGPVAKPLIPDLKRLLYGDKCPKEAAIALAAMGPEGWQILTEAIGSTNGTTSACSVWALGSHRAFVQGTFEALEANLAITNEELGNRPMTGWALAQLGDKDGVVIPLLINGLHSQRQDYQWGCSIALGEFGRDAQAAEPDLLKLLSSRNPVVRHDAAQALEEIDPAAAKQAGVSGALATKHVPRTMMLP